MTRFKGKYRTESSRLTHWDYSWPGLYFVTVCTKDRIAFFGEIENGQLQLSRFGKIAEKHWLRTFTLRKDMNLTMGDYVFMPNHLHAIIGIGENPYNSGKDIPNGGLFEGRDAMHRVSTGSQNKFGPQSKNLGSVIRGFKSAVTTSARKIGFKFAWQPRYHDHIIRNEKSYHLIRNYIIHNPKNWEADRDHTNPNGLPDHSKIPQLSTMALPCKLKRTRLQKGFTDCVALTEAAAAEELGMSTGSTEPELNSYWFTSDHLVSLSLDKYGKVAVDFCSNQGARKEHSPSYASEEQRRVEQKDQDLVRLGLVVRTLVNVDNGKFKEAI